MGVTILCVQSCVPCDVDADCPDFMFCSQEGTCAQECTRPGDCPAMDEGCSLQGRCTQQFAPLVSFVGPDQGSSVRGTFDAVVDVTWTGEQLDLVLSRNIMSPGEDCAPFQPVIMTLYGDPLRENRQTIQVPSIPVFGEGVFALQATARADDQPERTDVLRLMGELDDTIVQGARIQSPLEGVVSRNPVLSVPLEVELPRRADRVWAFSVSERGLSTARRSVAVETAQVNEVRVPIMQGKQLIQLDVETDGSRKSCYIAVETEASTHNRLEVGLFFESDTPGNLDMWIYKQPDDGQLDVCTAHDVFNNVCLEPFTTVGISDWGEEIVQLDLDDGVYGVAVAPGAISEEVTALIRVGKGNNPIGWLGPTTVVTPTGDVWLAGRIYVIQGDITLEALDLTHPGLPSADPSTW